MILLKIWPKWKELKLTEEFFNHFNFEMRRNSKFVLGTLLEAEMKSDNFPLLWGTFHPVEFRYSDSEWFHCCRMLAFDVHYEDFWNRHQLSFPRGAEPNREYNVGDKVHVKGHRGPAIDGKAEFVWMKAKIVSKRDVYNNWEVEYDAGVWFPDEKLKETRVRGEKIRYFE